LDSNCDGDPDDCDEDLVPPSIDLAESIAACTNSFFKTEAEALACVNSTAKASDDCNGIKTLTISRGSGVCATSSIMVSAHDGCGRASNKTLPVKIDNGFPPVVKCKVGTGGTDLSVNQTGPGVLQDVNFTYSATDGGTNPCGISSVQVDVFANELENFNAQVMAQFATLTTGGDRLWLASSICATSTNGQCIKDPVLNNVRLYTIVVTATDMSGQASSAECKVKVLPGNGTAASGTSVQRFHLTSLSF
jgi:hypothetical protein